MSPESSTAGCPNKREIWTRRHRHTGRRPCDNGDRLERGSCDSRSTKHCPQPLETERGMEQTPSPSRSVSRRNQLCQYPDSRFLASRTVRQFLLFYCPEPWCYRFLVLCCNSPRKPIQLPSSPASQANSRVGNCHSRKNVSGSFEGLFSERKDRVPILKECKNY